jgi:AcrR family transcriptional regulator
MPLPPPINGVPSRSIPPNAEVGDRDTPLSRIDGRNRVRRADADRNRRRILDVAARLFRARGIGVSTSSLAARTGLGSATIYRHFPSRDDLLLALHEDAARTYEQVVARALTEHDPMHGLERLLRTTAAMRADTRGCAEEFADAFPELLAAHESRMRAASVRLFHAAQRTGRVRAGVTAEDLTLVSGAVDGVLASRPADPRVAVQRALTLVLQGIVQPAN